ncbi:MAG: hypothetical protein HYS21_08590 [Deltaproteobacteria bacterium]|nr:hypothetical protein [Deltaproteobacteria bacterium]
MERLISSKWFHLIISAVLAISILLAYSNTFHAKFQFDDILQIVDNQQLKDLGNLPEIIKNSRGLSFASFAVNYAISGNDTISYHVVNVSIHIINAVLAYFFLLLTLRLIKSDEPWCRRIAAFSALIFALHPIQTQSVTYIVQRMESLFSLFYLVALLFFIKSSSASSMAKRVALYAGVAVSFILAVYSKEVAITLPGVVLLYDFFFLSKGSPKEIVKKWPLYFILAALFIFFAFSTFKLLGGAGDAGSGQAITQAHAPAQESDATTLKASKALPEHSAGFKQTYISPKEYLYTQFNVFVYYIALLAVPVNQNLDYDFPVARSLFKAPVPNKGTILNIPMLPPIVALAILLAIIGAGIYLYFRSRKGCGDALAISFFIFWFFIILSPTSSFIPIIDVIYEHRVYLASLGLFTVFVICVDMAFGKIVKVKS